MQFSNRIMGVGKSWLQGEHRFLSGLVVAAIGVTGHNRLHEAPWGLRLRESDLADKGEVN